MADTSPTVSYDHELRSRLRDGDLVLCTGNGPSSRLIRLLTGSRFSHSAIVLHWHDRVLVAEATGSHGVHVWPLSECVKKYGGRVTLFQPKPEVRDQLDLPSLFEATMNHLGTGYRTMGLFQIGWHLLWARSRAMKDARRHPPRRELVFSELVSACYRAAGVDLVPGVPDGYTTPADIERSTALVRVGRLTPRHWKTDQKLALPKV